MERIRLELEAEGYDVQIVTVNKGDAVEFQQKLIDKCASPLLQDTEDNLGWNLMQGGKDDFFVYNGKGELVSFLPMGGEVETNLSKEEGYANVKNAILSAFEEGP